MDAKQGGIGQNHLKDCYMNKLASKGGLPVRSSYLPYGRQWIEEDDIKAVLDVLRSQWITQGSKVDEFEERIAQYCGAKYAVAVANGTAALHAACAVAGITSGDEVITTPLTFAATSNSVVYCGGKPIFADIQEDTLNIDPLEIKNQLTPQTKAIISVDFAGFPADIDGIKKIKNKGGLVFIEDACHALGAEYKGRKIGTFADMTVFSFHPVKHITSGEGGMITTDSEDLYKKLKVFRHHGIERNSNNDIGPWYYEINRLGYNFRLTDFQCALGSSQLHKLDSFIERRLEIADRYNKAFSDIKQLVLPKEIEDTKPVYHIYVVQLRLGMLKVGRLEIFKALQAENIGVNVHYIPAHLHPYYQKRFGYKKGDYPLTEQYYEQAITLPIFPKMSDRDAQDVIDAVCKVIDHYKT